VEVWGRQQVDAAIAQLQDLGITGINVDHVRSAAVVTAARSLPLGNVRTASLAAIHADSLPVRRGLAEIFAGREDVAECAPVERRPGRRPLQPL
jgi:hypothetical protein